MSLEHLEKLDRKPANNSTLGYSQEEASFMLDDYRISPTALARLSVLLGIPRNFIPECSPSLGLNILTEFERKEAHPLDVLIDQNTGFVESFVPATFKYIPIDAVERAFTAGTGMTAMVKNAFGGIERFNYLMLDASATVLEKDDLHFGISMRGSLDGSTAFQAMIGIYRVVCGNGLMVADQKWTLRQSQFDTVAEAEDLIGIAAGRLFDASYVYQQKIRVMMNTPLASPEDTLLNVIRAQRLPRNATDLIIDAYREEPVATQWGVLNALTRAGNTLGDDDQINFKLYETAGIAAGRVLHDGITCPVCHNALGNGHSH